MSSLTAYIKEYSKVKQMYTNIVGFETKNGKVSRKPKIVSLTVEYTAKNVLTKGNFF